MPSKKGPKEEITEYSDDEEEFYSSDDDYYSDEEYQSDDDYQSGGADDEKELDSDSANLDPDPDDEADPNEDDKYDAIDENEELEDPDQETDIEEENAEEEGEGEAEEMVNEEEEFIAETKSCHLKNLNKDFIVLDEDDSNIYAKMEYTKIADEDRETDPVLTYYEMVRVIGTRAQQFNYDAPPLVKGIEDLPPAKMAYIELISKQTPFIVRRHLPGKKYEDWRIDELEIIHTIDDEFFLPENFDWDELMKQSEQLSQMARNVNSKKLK